MKIIHYLTILRPVNAIMAAGAVWLGAWLTGSPLSAAAVSLLAFVAGLSTGFGNVINDILDRETDRISHPDRPLPSGAMLLRSAIIYGVVLAAAAVSIAFTVSPRYGIATLAPLSALVLYALLLKGTPLAGNLLVSLLVAYSLLFGSLDAPGLYRLLIPAGLAMLLNFCREIVKDIEDATGDRSAGITTTAILPETLLKKILIGCSMLYALTVFLPVILGHFGVPYCAVVCILAIPLHLLRITLLLRNNWTDNCGRISLLLKFEMLAGLAALAADKIAVILSA